MSYLSDNHPHQNTRLRLLNNIGILANTGRGESLLSIQTIKACSILIDNLIKCEHELVTAIRNDNLPILAFAEQKAPARSAVNCNPWTLMPAKVVKKQRAGIVIQRVCKFSCAYYSGLRYLPSSSWPPTLHEHLSPIL